MANENVQLVRAILDEDAGELTLVMMVQAGDRLGQHLNIVVPVSRVEA